MPSSPPSSLDNWWCDATDEFAFLGFSYEVTACQSQSQLNSEFADIRNNFNGRYVRLYGFCDNDGFYDDVIEAAWTNGLGVHALVWFGFDGTDQWEGRRDTLFGVLHSNPKAKFVTRVVQFGSEPLFDSVLTPAQLTTQVNNAKKNLTSLSIPVTVSELAYGYQERGGAQDVLDAIDSINIHMLPFFASTASTSAAAWPLVLADLNFFVTNGGKKKMYMDENGWPNISYTGVEPNSPNAVANTANEKGYFGLLDQHCSDLKAYAQGGIGWFAHIYSDDQEPGYGIYDVNGKLKFPFAPRTTC
ncbi:glycoside hydrolase family 17 protein [Athelia psychrophila]|uniref:glucan endo-1,3-beta-D-glucosidase n=1 Tax=Athelia psychrophila TaxID=1759441 RepID=A0A166X221_9AGAM|nr:glycoside hydrolase family 17 protein [Fibularhizoctonia sp. CBS 109695]